ncbi:MAG: hypothetical protein CBD88_01045 [Flavobacteriales bacterium TMED228]|nr:MAG: hypothetical protein CBD88_01045 [Flavobacteriales bacterium TMED228]
MNKVKKSLRKKRHAGGIGGSGSGQAHEVTYDQNNPSGGTTFTPHNPNDPGHDGGNDDGGNDGGNDNGGGDDGGGGPPVSIPKDPRVGYVTSTQEKGKPPKVDIQRGVPFTVQKSPVEKVGTTTDLPAVNMAAPEDATEKNITAQEFTGEGYTAKTAPTPKEYTTATYNAFKAEEIGPTKAAQGKVTRVAEADGPELTERAKAAERVRPDEREALAKDEVFDEDLRSQVDKVTGQTVKVSPTREAELKQRRIITGEPAPDGEPAEILSLYNFDKAQQREIRGAEAKAKVLSDLKEQGIPDDVAADLADDPEKLAAAADSLDDGIKTRLSGLPKEALVSTQMESLLAGMEEGKTPSWAKPALAAVEANLAQRGLDVSTVGRDALFNSIIQSAIPLAQSNAQAIQAATSQDKTIAGQFLIKNAEFKQQMELANLSNDQQMRLANLTAENQAESENLNAAQQTELANLQTRLQTNLKQAELAGAMNQSQLSVDQQRAVTNAMTVAKIDMSKFSTAQQVELSNSKFLQSATLTDFNARQQEAMQNATMLAQMDLATADQNTKLAIENARNFLQMDLSNLSNRQQVNIFDQQMRQQTMLTNAAATNASRQFNATSENQKNQFMKNMEAQMNQFNATSVNQAKQFSAAEQNKAKAVNAGNVLAARTAQAQLNTQVEQFNSQMDFNRDQWNAANKQAVLQSNVEWRRKANLIDTAAQNASNQMAAQMQFNLDSAEQSFLWQNLRDEASYIRQSYENEEQRKTSLYATALGNETSAEKGHMSTNNLTTWIAKIFG